MFRQNVQFPTLCEKTSQNGQKLLVGQHRTFKNFFPPKAKFGVGTLTWIFVNTHKNICMPFAFLRGALLTLEYSKNAHNHRDYKQCADTSRQVPKEPEYLFLLAQQVKFWRYLSVSRYLDIKFDTYRRQGE